MGRPFLGVRIMGILRAQAKFRRARGELHAYDARASRRTFKGCAGTYTSLRCQSHQLDPSCVGAPQQMARRGSSETM
jgi:hypothetical protein